MDEVLEALRRIESGKDEAGRLEEVEVGGEGVSYADVHSPSPISPDHNEVKLLKNMKATPSPKAVTDKWYSGSLLHLHFVWIWKENKRKENGEKENKEKNIFSLLLFGWRENRRENKKKEN